jgi:hypothetical protein
MHIKQLTEKEEQLYGKSDLTDEDVNDLHLVKSELDQYWDLLRQRRAFVMPVKTPTGRRCDPAM